MAERLQTVGYGVAQLLKKSALAKFVNSVCNSSKPPVTEKRSVIRVVKSASRP